MAFARRSNMLWSLKEYLIVVCQTKNILYNINPVPVLHGICRQEQYVMEPQGYSVPTKCEAPSACNAGAQCTMHVHFLQNQNDEKRTVLLLNSLLFLCSHF